MSETVTLPALGESVTEGTVTRWLKQVGEHVEVDEPLVEVSTDKVDTEVPSPVAGVIEEILVPEDETAEVGAPLVRIGAGDSSSSDAAEAPAAPAAEESEPEQAVAPAAEQEPAAEPEQPAAQESAPQSSGEGQEVKLPELGESVTEGTVTRWLKEVGDQVEVDEPLLEVSTDKVDTEVPSPVAGTLLEVRVSEDDTVEVGAVLAVVGSGAPAQKEEAPKQAEAPKQQEAPQQEAPKQEAPKQEAPKQEAPKQAPQQQEAPKQAEAPKQEQAQASSSAAGYVTPLVRKLANDHGVDLASVTGTGVGGRIRKQDVQEAIDAQAAAPAAPAAPAASSKAPAAPSAEAAKLRGSTIKAPRIRQVIAKRMRESLDISTQLTQVQEVDMTRIVKLRKSAKSAFAANNGVNLTYLPFIAEAVTEALKQFPAFNASYDQDKQEITYHEAEHLGIAVDTDKGLLVPVISDAGDLNLAGLSKKIADVADRARTNKLGPDELSGSTFSITNIGSVGALFDTPIINQPNVGILGTGIIQKRPVVVQDADGEDVIAIRHMMYLSLTYDHRLVDGANAGRFLQSLKARLEGADFKAELGL